MDAARAPRDPRGRARPRARRGSPAAATLRGAGRRAGRGPGPQVAVRRARRRSLGCARPRTTAGSSGKLANEVRGALTGGARRAPSGAASGGRGVALLEADRIDLTLPGRRPRTGSLHPLTIVERRDRRGVHPPGLPRGRGPEIEDDWHNFEALNIPPDHPARTMKDSLYVERARASRAAAAHRDVSAVQIRTMQSPAAARLHRRARDGCTGARPPTPRTRRCSIRWRAWRSTRASRSPT